MASTAQAGQPFDRGVEFGKGLAQGLKNMPHSEKIFFGIDRISPGHGFGLAHHPAVRGTHLHNIQEGDLFSPADIGQTAPK